MWFLLFNLIFFLVMVYFDFCLNLILNVSVVVFGKENGVFENELNEIYRICIKLDVVY